MNATLPCSLPEPLGCVIAAFVAFMSRSKLRLLVSVRHLRSTPQDARKRSRKSDPWLCFGVSFVGTGDIMARGRTKADFS
jgi:hypothetical protein